MFGIRFCVQGKRRGMFGIFMSVGIFGLFFLEVPAVRQQDRAEVTCGWAAIYLACEAVRDQERQITTMIQMRMCQYDRINFRRVDWKRRPVSQPQLFESLKQAAVTNIFLDPIASKYFDPVTVPVAPRKAISNMTLSS
jgi:hypothetical protein